MCDEQTESEDKARIHEAVFVTKLIVKFDTAQMLVLDTKTF